MSTIKIEKNVLLKEDLKTIHDTLINSNFPWYYSSSQASQVKDGIHLLKDEESYLFHLFFQDLQICSPSFNILSKLLQHIKPVALLGIKANLNINKNRTTFSAWHTDIHRNQKLNHKTSVFYINTNNGYTEFKTGEKSMSEENTLITFEADNLHRTCTQTDTPYRIVINLNYFN